MKYFLSFLFVAAMLVSGFSQEQVIGRSMVLKTNGHPDSIPSLTAPAVNFGNAVVLDTVSGDMYTFNYATEAWQKMVSENSAEARPYKVYTALLTQTGTNAPVATVLENTLGGVPVWSRNSTGVYKTTLANAFPESKTFLHLTSPGDGADFGSYHLGVSRDNSSIVSLEVGSSGIAAELSTLGVVFPVSIEIRVYP